MFAEKAGSTSSRMSCPSNSDHISLTVSSPTRVTTPPISFSTASTASRLACQSACVRGSLRANRTDLARLTPVAQRVCKPWVVLHVVDACPNIDEGRNIRCTLTSLTCSPLIQTWRPSRIESRYCCPVRIIGVLYRLCDCRLALSRETQSAPISRGSGERLARDVHFRGILAQ